MRHAQESARFAHILAIPRPKLLTRKRPGKRLEPRKNHRWAQISLCLAQRMQRYCDYKYQQRTSSEFIQDGFWKIYFLFPCSTDKQGRSGLGLEAQREAVAVYLNGGNWTVLAEFTEVESGRKAERPQLVQALEMCRLIGAVLVIAKLDRLARDAHFLLGLEKAGVEFVACDMPTANRRTIGIMALVAEEEARAISARTTAALAAAKARGTALGGWREGRWRSRRSSEPPGCRGLREGPRAHAAQDEGRRGVAATDGGAARGSRHSHAEGWSLDRCGVRNVLARA